MPNTQGPQSNFAPFYDDTTYSDVTVRFAGRGIEAHRMILSTWSVVFRRALSPDSAFKESQTGIYDLDEDDLNAVEYMLRYIYTSVYTPVQTAAEPVEQWERHLNVAIVDKYDLPGLEDLAIEACAADINTNNLEDSDSDVLHLVNRAATYYDGAGKLAHLISEKVNMRVVDLFPNENFQKWLQEHAEEREKLITKYFDDLLDGSEVFREMLRSDGEMALRQ